jgi:rhodanese-related sulfurtransferase
MANVKRVSPLEAKGLLDQGYTYVDVRTVEEFHAGHPTGALNVPLTVAGPAGSQMNPEFTAAIEARFARDAKIVVGCASGVRSLRAVEILTSMGYRDVVDQRAGFGGSRSPFGARAEPGWAELGLPISLGPDRGSYQALMGSLVK